jgi:hypothetical protein
MKLYYFLAIALLLGIPVQAQTVPYNSVVLTWPDTYPAGGTLADPSGLQYIVEVLAPGGNGWGPIAVLKGVYTYRLDDLDPGFWQFRIKLIEHGRVFWLASNVVSKNVVTPMAPPWVPPPPLAGLTIK